MSITTQPMAPERSAITSPHSFKEPELRCEKCSAIPWYDEFAKLGWFQCSRQDCKECYPVLLSKSERLAQRQRNNFGAVFDHYDSFVQLEQSAKNGCQICRVFVMELGYKYRKIKSWTSGDFSLSRVHLRKGKYDVGTDGDYGNMRLPRILLALPGGIDEKGMKFRARNEMRVTRQRFDPDARLPTATDEYSNSMSETIESDLQRINKQAIQPWLKICQQHHTMCKSAPHHAFVNYPTRLVWVGDTATDDVKLVETGEQCPPYLILSYCWGKSNDSAKTTETNYAERTKAIRTCELPKTIRDAIQLTRAMGEKYIWIDAMCIKQTDKSHTGDWATEASKVGDYYAHAKCLISALSAAESGQGFLGERLAWRYPQRYAFITHGMTPCKGERICFFIRAPEQEFECDTASWQPLTERGWCLQERLLCPRRLQWTRNGLYWECNTVHASEADALSGRYPPDDHEMMSQLKMNTILQQEEEEALGNSWIALVKEYSRRKFTVQSDRLLAIHGIASLLAKRHDEAYYAGIFSSHLVDGLMWFGGVETDPSHSPDQCKGFPTWSWASASGEVSWPMTRVSSDAWYPYYFVDLIRFPPCDPNPDFTKMASRELLIRAPLARFTLDGPETKPYVSGRQILERIEIQGPAGLWEDLDCDNAETIGLCVPKHAYTTLKPGSVLFAAILFQKPQRSFYGIVLKKVTVRNRAVYMREGIFEVSESDTYSLFRPEGKKIRILDGRLWQSELTLV